jgi:phosphoglycolate phosphatase
MTLICFDLDGTLVDPLEGMHGCLQAACQAFGLLCPDRDRIAEHVGLDLEALFPDLPSPRRRAVMAHYWRIFGEEGLFTQRIHDGVHLMLARLKRQGHRLLLVTNQPAGLARQTLHQFDLLLIFDDVIGLLPQETWKPKREIMGQLQQDGVLAAGGYLIGDRADDMGAAKAHGLRAVGVTCGYGNLHELTEADVLLDSIHALDGWLGTELRDPEIHDPFSRSE